MRSLEAAVTGRLRRLPATDRRALYRAVETAEREAALLHRVAPGRPAVPHPLALTPFVVPRRLLPRLARLARLVHRFQAHAPCLYRDDVAGFRTLCPLPEATERWLDRGGVVEEPVRLMIRPDVGLVGQGPGARPVLFETNATALAGLYNHTVGVAILRRLVLPRVLTARERAALAPPPDLLALTVGWIRRAAHRLGLGRRPRVGFVEEPGPVAGYSEVPALVRAFRARGIPACAGGPEDLRVRRGRLYLGDARVDLVYREVGLEALGAGPGATRLAGLRAALAAGAVLPGLAGEFAHKGLLEAMLHPRHRGLFTPAERRWLARHVPWTRVLWARRTEDPRGRLVDLPEYVRRHRPRLLIKPNVGSSGDGVLLGCKTSPARWEARIAAALRQPGVWVVQEWRPTTPRPMLYLRGGVATAGPCHFSLGLFYAAGRLGLHCRVSRRAVVNVARGGALACAFIGP